MKKLAFLGVALAYVWSGTVARAENDEQLGRFGNGIQIQNYQSAHRRAVDRYNKLLNQVAFANGIRTREVQKPKIPTETYKGLKNARAILSRSLLLGMLKNRHPTDDALDTIMKQLGEAELFLKQAEDAWKAGSPQASTAVIGQVSECAGKLHDAEPLSPTEIDDKITPIEKCVAQQKIALQGVILTYDGLKEFGKLKPLPVVRVASQAFVENEKTADPKRSDDANKAEDAKKLADAKKPEPKPAAAPEKPSKLEPKPAPLDEESKAKLSVLPVVPGMKFVRPPSKQDLLKGAQEMVKNYDPAKASLVKPPLDEFLLATETDGNDSFPVLYRYSYARARWNLSIEKYRSSSGGDFKKALKLSNREFWKSYTRDSAEFSDFMVGNGGNCEAQTKMIVSMINRLTPKLEPGQHLLTQGFSDHIQPVIYDENKNEVLNLITGKRQKGTMVDLYDPMVLVNSWLKGQDKNLGRDPEAFVRLKANVEAPKELLAENAGDGGAETNSGLDLPKGKVRFTLNDIPEHTTISEPEFDESVASIGGGSGFFATGLGEGTSKKSVAASGLSDNVREWDVNGVKRRVELKFVPSMNKLNTVYCSHTIDAAGDRYCSAMIFTNQEMFEKASKMESYQEVLRYGLKMELQNSFQSPDTQKSKKEFLRFLRDPLNAVAPKSNGGFLIDSGIGTNAAPYLKQLEDREKRQMLIDADPEMKEVFELVNSLRAKTAAQPYLFAKAWMNHPVNSVIKWKDDFRSSLDDVEMLEKDFGLGSGEASWPPFEAVIDAEHAVWTEEDFKKFKKSPPKKNKAVAEEKAPDPQEALSALEEKKPLGDTSTSPWEDPRDYAKPKKAKVPPQPMYIPKDPLKAYNTDRVLSAIIDVAAVKRMTREQRENVARLWTPAFQKKALRGNDLNLAHNRTALLAAAFPENRRCEIYSVTNSSSDKNTHCFPREVAELSIHAMESEPVFYGGKSRYYVQIGERQVLLSLTELSAFVRAQLDGKPVRADLAELIKKARSAPVNPDLVTDEMLNGRIPAGMRAR